MWGKCGKMWQIKYNKVEREYMGNNKQGKIRKFSPNLYVYILRCTNSLI